MSDDDLPLFQRAQELAGGTLSAAIAAALRRYVEVEEGRQQGYDDVVVRVGPGLGRKQRFSGVLLAEMERTGNERDETYRVYRTRSEKYVVHLERSEAQVNTGPNAEKYRTGWRAWVGDWSANQSWTRIPADSSLRIADDLDALRGIIPTELYELVLDAVHEPTIEDLDI
ncbi:EXLDI protein [Micromonospora sp. WMMD812]|uniref:EXLDI protein n=1 Tax=Micromonospora sp. WMMD812 TaxID=3015152 RepID=UPI00248D08D6|nr:EXLDI protein [Micromonospora sp. WMMD812]WBB65374.1 EXLDI protein [Micromonospora sp. WMMD812]